MRPRPGRIFAAARSHTFVQPAHAIDEAFARRDRARLHEFTLADGTRLTTPYEDWEELGPAADDRQARLSRPGLGERLSTSSTSVTTGPTSVHDW